MLRLLPLTSSTFTLGLYQNPGRRLPSGEKASPKDAPPGGRILDTVRLAAAKMHPGPSSWIDRRGERACPKQWPPENLWDRSLPA
jgi:hypothetical protein